MRATSDGQCHEAGNREQCGDVDVEMRVLLLALVVFTLSGCAAAGSDAESLGAAPLRGFGIDVDEALASRVRTVHLKTCGPWGCHEQEVPLHVSGPTSAMPCPSASAAPEAACGVKQLPGPGPGYGYAPVPSLTLDPVTVRVTTPRDAPFPIDAEVRVRPSPVCPGSGRAPCGDAATPQAQLRIAADGTVSQYR